MLTERESDSGNVAEEPSNSRSKRFCVLTDERRQATRFPREEGTAFAVIWRKPGEEIVVEVHDESLTGLGILVDAELDLQPGGYVYVVYAGAYMQGEVMHSLTQPEGKVLVGLRCQRLLREETE